MRVALVHDWLTGMRGGEKTLEVVSQLFPGADLYTLVHVRGSVSRTIEQHPVHTSVVQWLPAVKQIYRHYLVTFPTAIEWLDLDGYDLVVSTSHCAAKAVIAPKARHLCYCFTPMRYAWDQFDAYFGPARLGRPASSLAGIVMRHLARWDRATAGRVNRYVAISHYVASRIRRYYNREALVVYPPVDTGFYHPDGRSPGTYVLVVSALVPYKRVDVAIEAARLAGVPLKIVGEGPERAGLMALGERVGADVQWLGRVADEEVRDLYRGAAAVVLPGEEDFGIVPVEAQACGRPVVALGRGGARETVVSGITGVLVDEATADALASGVKTAVTTTYDGAAIRAHAEQFGIDRFLTGVTGAVNELLARPQDTRW
jgi:glycosyltransferase involved in cell wall biosynthesis